MNEESVVVCAFFMFIGTMYHACGSMIAGSLDASINVIKTSYEKLDDNLLKDLLNGMAENRKLEGLDADVHSTYELADDLQQVQAEVLNYQQEHLYHDAIVKKLDSLVSLEQAAAASLRDRMVSTVQKDVVTLFTSNKTAKDNALKQAIAVLGGGGNAKMGKDVVGDAFGTAIKAYREMYSKLPAGEDDILVALEKDMKAVANAPIVDTLGGNVFLSHPIRTIGLKATA